MLKQWFWKDGVSEVQALNVWQQTCQQVYLPRLKDDGVFLRSMVAGASSQDFFGFAQGKDNDRYPGFSFGQTAAVFLDSACMFIEPGVAVAYANRLRQEEEARRPTPEIPVPPATGTGGLTLKPPHAINDTTGQAKSITAAGSGTPPAAQASVKMHFFGSIELDPIQAKKQFADIVEEVLLQFTSRPGVKVKIAIEIEAESGSGFDDGVQRSVKENCNVLKFRHADFED